MRSKSFVFALMVLLIAGGILFTVSCGNSGEAAKPSGDQKTVETPSKPMPPQANVDIVYYFMTTQRCVNCMKIEAYSKEAVEKGFADALKKGSMIWRMVNVDQSANNHFIKDYQLFTKSVVLVKMRDGKQTEWKNLDKIWNLLNDQAAFQKYVTDEVKQFVEKG
ncbi:MAG: nitrophenyl compound nitroreductase subunit ArsF family protein [Candidatus Latescibacterota bacterium]